MAQFLTSLKTDCPRDGLYILLEPLIYVSDILGRIEVPAEFHTDFASVPRVPIVYLLWGNRAHREATIHDWLFRQKAWPECTWMQANQVFREAMIATGKSWWIREPMYVGVVIGSYPSWKKRMWNDRFPVAS